ncbi:histone demethylation 3d [Fusarium denticulatum]|uniref:Histone demethylation 3d n=1 Tax=Fusarium denticulatum TaxID=48507 RepID=A0A8H5XDF2_9HYPO|nr:histone demethylation 3d [Fusarium denticulatum]
MVETFKYLVAEVSTEAYVENIHTLLDARIKELESAVEHVATTNELSNLNSMRKTGSIVDVSEAAQGVLGDPTQQTSDQDQTATSENEGQPSTSQPDVISEPHPDTIANTASPPASPAATQSEVSSPEPILQSYAKRVISRAAKAAVHKGQLQQLGEDLAAIIYVLASDTAQIQKTQVSGLAEAMKHRPADTWNLEPRDGGDVNRNIIQVDSGDHIRMRTTNEEQLFHQPGFQGVNYRMEKGEVAIKLSCFIDKPERSVPNYAGVIKFPLWDLCPLHAGRLAEIQELTRAYEPYAHCGWPRSGTAMHKEDANLRSVNVGFARTKAFLLVNTRDTKMFEDWVRDTIPGAPPKGKCCDQWVRHLSIIFRPGQLEGAGMRFTILIQGVGDLIFTKRNQMPSAAVRPNAALASLYLSAGFHIEIGNNKSQKGKKRKALHGDDDDEDHSSVKAVRPEEPKNEPFSAGVIRYFLRTAAPKLEMPMTLDQNEVRLYRMITSVLSDQAKQQIVSLMLGFRTAPTTISNEADLTDKSHVNAYLRYFEEVEKQSILTEFQVEYARSCLAKRTHEVLQEEDRDQVTATNIDQVSQELGMDVNTFIKMKDHYHTGRAWNKVCDDFDGLLPFIFTCARWPYKVTVKDWRDLTKESRTKMTDLLRAGGIPLERRLLAGKWVQDIIFRGAEDVFVWECVENAIWDFPVDILDDRWIEDDAKE